MPLKHHQNFHKSSWQDAQLFYSSVVNTIFHNCPTYPLNITLKHAQVDSVRSLWKTRLFRLLCVQGKTDFPLALHTARFLPKSGPLIGCSSVSLSWSSGQRVMMDVQCLQLGRRYCVAVGVSGRAIPRWRHGAWWLVIPGKCTLQRHTQHQWYIYMRVCESNRLSCVHWYRWLFITHSFNWRLLKLG